MPRRLSIFESIVRDPFLAREPYMKEGSFSTRYCFVTKIWDSCRECLRQRLTVSAAFRYNRTLTCRVLTVLWGSI